MRYATFSTADDPTPRLGALRTDKMFDVQKALAGASVQNIPRTLLELIQTGTGAGQRIGDRLMIFIG